MTVEETATRNGAPGDAASVEPTVPDPVAGYRFTVVPHTHWDREWYLPFEEFRIRLVRVVEEVCDVLEADPRFTAFTLDGQAVILDDVLELRPDLEPRLRALLSAGRLVTGPSYVLVDEFLASPESLVRNLLVGRATCERLGAPPMAVAYQPDPFGHVGQLPQILRGFGLDAFIFWRGLGDEASRVGLAFDWRAPDGSSVTAIRQLGSYGNACQLGRWAAGGIDLVDQPERYPETASARFVRYVTVYGTELERTFGPALERIGPREAFVCNGSDHERIQAALPDLLERARDDHPLAAFEIGTYEAYWRRLAPTLGPLPQLAGELVSGRDAPVLRGINSARVPLKQAAERTERALVVAETLASLAALGGWPYPRHELGRAWREQLKNLPHDSISGCSVDEVHRDMAARFAIVEQIAGRVRREALAHLAGGEEPWTYRPAPVASVSIVNPLAHARRGVAAVPLPPELDRAGALVAADAAGTRIAAQLGQDEDGGPCALVALDLGGFEARSITLSAGDRDAAPADAVAATSVAPATISNGQLTVTARRDGSIEVTDGASGRTWTGLHRYEDVADRGDEYNFCPLDGDRPVLAVPDGTVSVVGCGPVVAELEVRLALRLPERLAADRRRREGLVDVPVRTRIRLTAGSRRIEFTTTVDNGAQDHRLRVRFAAPGARHDGTVRAEGHFAVVPRTVRPVWSGAGWVEPPALTHHAAGSVAAGDLVVLARGLPEYEAVPTRDGLDLALTLLRCVGRLSRDDLATRPGHAGPGIATPDAQCPGRHVFEYAIELGEAPSEGTLLRASADYRTPFVVGPAGIDTGGLLSVEGDVVVTALKGAEDGDGIVLRAVAPSGGAIRVAAASQLDRVRLDETPEEGNADAPLRAGEIRTIRLRPTASAG